MGKPVTIRAESPEGAILRLLDFCTPADIAIAVDMFIERLDKLAGDPDVEANGDELDGTTAEDDFVNHNLSWIYGPGCPVSDDDACSAGEDDLCLPAYGLGHGDEI